MAFANTNEFITGQRQLRTPSGAEVVAQRFTIVLPTSDLQASDCGIVGYLPAGCIPLDVTVDGTDVDTGSGGAAQVFAVGLASNATGDDISTAAADGGGEWGRTTAVKTAFTQRLTLTLQALVSVTKSESTRALVLKVITAPETAAAGTLGVTLFYCAA